MSLPPVPREHEVFRRDSKGRLANKLSWPWEMFFEKVHDQGASIPTTPLSASMDVQTDSDSNLVSVANTGTVSNVMSASPTLTGTVTAAAANFSGNITIGGTLGVTGVATFTAQPIASTLTASQAVFTDGSKGLVSNTITGTGNVMMSTSPTTTGTLTAAIANFSGAVTALTINVGSTIAVTGVLDEDDMASDSAVSLATQQSIAAFGNNTFALREIYNGTFKETFDAVVTSNGTIITMSLEQQGTGDLTMQFSDNDTTLDCTPAATIALTAGSDTSPQGNWIYILQSTKALTKSTSSWPTPEHIKVAYFLVQSAASVQTVSGVYVNQNWNDHVKNGNDRGHLTHLAERMRHNGTVYFSGLDPNGTDQAAATSYFDDAAGSAAFFKSTAGMVYQLHSHTMPAIDTSSTDKIHAINWSGDAYHIFTDLFDIVSDSAGGALNNKYFNVFFFGVANKTGEHAPIMCQLPSGSYVTETNATNDVDGFDNLTMPRQFGIDSSTGVAICRMTFKWTGGTTTLTHISTLDLRTTDVAGGASTGGTVTDFADNQFSVFDEADTTKILNLDVGTLVTTGNTRTLQVPDSDGVIALLSDLTLEDLDFAGDSGTGSVDLDSQSLTIAGTAGEITTSGSAQTLTVGLATNVTVAGTLIANGLLTANEGLAITDPTSAKALVTFSQTTGGLTSTVGQGASSLNLIANGANGFEVDTNGVARLTISSAGAGAFTGTLGVTGLITATAGLTSLGNVLVSTVSPVLILQDSNSTGAAQTGFISLKDSANSETGWMGYGDATTNLTIRNSLGNIILNSTGTLITGTLGVTGLITATAGLTTAGGPVTLGAGDDLIGSSTSDININSGGMFFSSANEQFSIGDASPGTGATLQVKNAANTPIVRITGADAGKAALTRTMGGLELVIGGMNTGSKYGRPIKFMSTDPQFTTESPKFLAAIVNRATESYAADTDGGTALDFFITPNNPGTTNIPVLAMTIDQDKAVAIGTETPEGSGLTINQGANDDIILSLKSSDVAHGMTDFAETDSYGIINKASATNGGIQITSLSESPIGGSMKLHSYSNVSEGTVGIELMAAKKNVAGITDFDSGQLLLTVMNNATFLMVIEGGGDVGINTVSPQYKMDVNGTFRAVGAGLFNSTLGVTGLITATAGLTTAGGPLTLGAGDDLIGSSTSDITINTNKFTVAGATGNTIIGGTLGVTGLITATAGLTTAGGDITLGTGDDLIGSSTSDIIFNTDKFTVAGATGNTVIAGTLTCQDELILTSKVNLGTGYVDAGTAASNEDDVSGYATVILTPTSGANAFYAFTGQVEGQDILAYNNSAFTVTVRNFARTMPSSSGKLIRWDSSLSIWLETD